MRKGLQTAHYAVSVAVLAAVLLLGGNPSGPLPSSSEVGFSSLSPRGAAGGAVIPASCELGFEHFPGECAPPPPPPTASLVANPSTIQAGNSSTLNFSCTYSTSASIDQGIGQVGGHGIPGYQPGGTITGSRPVSPAATTVYTLTCSGPDGSAQSPDTVTVLPLAPTLSVSLSADPPYGNAPLNGVDLTATVSGAAGGTINYTFYCDRSDAGVNITPGWAAKFDGINDNPKTALDACDYAAADSYTPKVIVERGAAPPAEARTLVTVVLPPVLPPPPSVDLKINGSDGPLTFEALAGYTASWSTLGADTCSASGAWSGGKAVPNGSQGFSDIGRGTYVYTLTCTNPGGQTPDSVQVNVIQMPQCTFAPNPGSIILPETSTLFWSCQFADSCSIDQGIGAVNPVSGNREVQPQETTLYTLTCQGADGERSYPGTVRVFSPSLREILPR